MVLDGWCVVRWEMGQDGVPSFGNGLKRVLLFRADMEWSGLGDKDNGNKNFLNLIPGSKSRFCLVRIQTHREASCIVARRRGTSTSPRQKLANPTRRRSPGDIVLLEHRAPSTEHHTTEHQSLNTAPTQPNGPNGQPTAMDGIPFDLEACTEHSSGAQRAALYLHELFNTGREAEAMKLVSAMKQMAWQGLLPRANTLDVILAEVPWTSLRKLIDNSPPLMYSEELVDRSVGRQEYDAKARRLLHTVGAGQWCGLNDADFPGISDPPANAPLSAPIFLDGTPVPVLEEYLDSVKDEPFFEDVRRFIREFNMFRSKASPMLQLWDEYRVEAEYGHLTLLMDEEMAFRKTIRRKLEKDRREGTIGFTNHTYGQYRHHAKEAAWQASWTPAEIEQEVEACTIEWRQEKENVEKEKKRKGIDETGAEPALAVCDNKLLFKIALDAYCGYDIESKFGFAPGGDFHDNAAVMGGAVLAALTAQRANPDVAALFEPVTEFWSTLDTQVLVDSVYIDVGYINSLNLSRVANQYYTLRTTLVTDLHKFFLHAKSNFKSGDIDVFLAQAVTCEESKGNRGETSESSKSSSSGSSGSSSKSSSSNSSSSSKSSNQVQARLKIVEKYGKYGKCVLPVLLRSDETWLTSYYHRYKYQKRNENDTDYEARCIVIEKKEIADQKEHLERRSHFIATVTQAASAHGVLTPQAMFDIKTKFQLTASEVEELTLSLFQSSSSKNGAGELLRNFAEQGVARFQEDFNDRCWFFCKTTSVLSMYYAAGKRRDYRDTNGNLPGGMWPRVTQLIELDPRARLIDALLDFDIDSAACLWNGANVLALPRAIRAMVSKTLLCRPGILQHSRNRARLSKYGRRGFASRLFDPMCRHNDEADGMVMCCKPLVSFFLFLLMLSRQFSCFHADF